MTIKIHYNPTVNFPNVENRKEYLDYCERMVRHCMEINNLTIDVPDPLAAQYIELHAKCLKCDIIFLNRKGDEVRSSDFYRPFASMYREAELFRTQIDDWLKGKAENPLEEDD